MKHVVTLILLVITFIGFLIHSGIHSLKQTAQNAQGTTQVSKASSQSNLKWSNHPSHEQADLAISPIRTQLPKNIKYNRHGAYVINNNQPTIHAKTGTQQYASNTVDNKHRPQVANAFLTKSARQYQNRNQTGNGRGQFVPLGWHQLTNLPGQYHYAYNRGHLLGYALVGNVKGFNVSESNQQNIVTQTSWANQADSSTNTGQNYYEGIVRKALDQNKKVRYQVKPLYSGNELVPRAIQLQALSTDHTVMFNVLVPNVQGNCTISYDTGNVVAGNNEE